MAKNLVALVLAAVTVGSVLFQPASIAVAVLCLVTIRYLNKKSLASIFSMTICSLVLIFDLMITLVLGFHSTVITYTGPA
ncbi:MAG: hypothetical protein ACRDAX_07910 [Propionibacteriaceae bacterium]